MRRPTHSTMSTSFHNHGLLGIDLDHATQRRAMQVARSRSGTSAVTGFRRRVGAIIMGAGEHLVGRQTSAESLPQGRQPGLAS